MGYDIFCLLFLVSSRPNSFLFHYTISKGKLRKTIDDWILVHFLRKVLRTFYLIVKSISLRLKHAASAIRKNGEGVSMSLSYPERQSSIKNGLAMVKTAI
jgi:hypothetical protein